VSDDEVGTVAGQLWGGGAEATWNRNRAAISSWLTWCQTRKRWPAPSVPADCERRREHPGQARAVSPRTAMRYIKPGGEAVIEVTELLDPPPRRH
jgi:hypothetical protein